ncbi:phosphoenolpyruvate--protein phosphotransferase [Pelagerythrobacter sp.]|uniref:phosphoenolpyruvate--protein phosphotransferase n=1 Tax=Pelagerythrobacter sp. TaxID=2800702 RepID=UPI0035B17A7C
MSLIVTAPVKGWVVPLESVPDPVFADRMMGDGVAIHPLEGTIVAPFDGTVIALHDSSHAITLRSAEGVELLIHVGIDTVALKGHGFTPSVSVGAVVSRGEELLRFDLDAVALAAPSLITPVLVTNAESFAISRRSVDTSLFACEALMTVEPLVSGSPRAAIDGPEIRQDVTLRLPHGIHARPAARIAKCARDFESDIRLALGERRADARSTAALLGLGTGFGNTVTVHASGPDAKAALAAMVALLESDMGEGQHAASAPAPAADAATLAPNQIGGIVASPGLATGPAVRLALAAIEPSAASAGPRHERAALSAARAQVRDRLAARTGSAADDVAAIMDAHLALLDDPALIEDAEAAIGDGKSAGIAWHEATRRQTEQLRRSGNVRTAQRADDFLDLERQVLAALSGESAAVGGIPTGSIVVADELLPSHVVALADARPAGIALAGGGPTSHVAILCAGLGIPAIVALGDRLHDIGDGTPLLFDARFGCVTIDPDADERAAFDGRAREEEARRASAHAAADREGRTADGTRIAVYANVASTGDAALAARHGAEGSGLVRSEFLFLGRDAAPSEDEQLASYRAIAHALPGKPIIIRLLDIGGDKPADYIPMAPEENPALGLRGIRVGLARPELLETQIRAILRVEPAGQCRIMLPMVASLDELRRVRAIVDRLCRDLGRTEPVELGVMVETPAAAITADLLAAEADFLSIGTNDLTQYVLAMDRGNPATADGVDAMHPAVLRMIAETCRRAAAHGRWVGVCGGLASDPAAIPILVGLGVTELSCVPGFVAEAKQIVRDLELESAREHAGQALRCASARETRALAQAFAQAGARETVS